MLIEFGCRFGRQAYAGARKVTATKSGEFGQPSFLVLPKFGACPLRSTPAAGLTPPLYRRTSSSMPHSSAPHRRGRAPALGRIEIRRPAVHLARHVEQVKEADQTQQPDDGRDGDDPASPQGDAQGDSGGQ